MSEFYFLLTYTGEDGAPKFRMMSGSELSSETPVEDIPYFIGKDPAKFLHTGGHTELFSVFHPIGGTEGKFDFTDIKGLFSIVISPGTTAWKYFQDISDPGIEETFVLLAHTYTSNEEYNRSISGQHLPN